jgi:heme-degrading monooxygenase HmoA
MYARVIKAVFGPDSAWEVQHIVNVLAAKSKQMNGFIDVALLADYENGEYESISWWETRDDAFLSYKAIADQLKEMVGDNIQWEPTVQIFEVYRPKSIDMV